MKTAVSYLTKQSPVNLAIGAGIIIAVVYVLGRQAVKEVAGVVGGVATGNNIVTQNQTNAAGEKVTAYEGAGILGTLGAGFNSLSGGGLATIGEKLGGWTFDLFGPKYEEKGK